jgi:hypothetical protein
MTEIACSPQRSTFLSDSPVVRSQEEGFGVRRLPGPTLVPVESGRVTTCTGLHSL